MMKKKTTDALLFDDKKSFSSSISGKMANYSAILFFIVILCIVTHMLYVAFFAYVGIPFMAGFNIISTAFYAFMLYIVKKKDFLTAGIGLCIEILAHVTMATIFIGSDYGFELQLFAVIAISFFLPYKKTSASYYMSAGAIIIFFLLYAYSHTFEPQYRDDVSSSIKSVVYLFNCCVTIVPLFLESYLFRMATEQSNQILFDRNKDLVFLASVDPLTNLYNRRYMEQKLETAFNTRERSGEPFCIAIGDIDNFKSFNDTYGHECGDYVLKTISGLISSSLRNSDCIARWGGEEMMILLNSTDVGSAIQTMERIRVKIADYDFFYQGKHMKVAMTFGLSWRRDNITDMLRQADEYLYHGKNNGKNQIVYDKNPQ